MRFSEIKPDKKKLLEEFIANPSSRAAFDKLGLAHTDECTLEYFLSREPSDLKCPILCENIFRPSSGMCWVCVNSFGMEKEYRESPGILLARLIQLNAFLESIKAQLMMKADF